MHPGFDLNGKIALVTGASSGFGAAFARVLADAGATVVLAARRRERIEALANEIRAAGKHAIAVQTDITDAGQISATFETAQAEVGTVNLIINNAGVGASHLAHDTPDGDWDRIVDTNFKGPWAVAREGANRMITAKTGGAIINVTSILAYRVQSGLGIYAASKAALDQLTRGMALELARHDIRVNAIAPGYFPTEMNERWLASEAGQAMRERVPMRRFGRIEELAGPLLLLASDLGAYMTGETLVVDGGHRHSTL